MLDFIVVNVYLGLIRDCMIGAISAKSAEAIIKGVVRENQTQRQEIVRSYQTTRMQDKTFISEMPRHHAPFDQIVNVLIEEQCDLLRGGPVFEAQIDQDAIIWGKRSVRTNVLNNKEGKKRLKFFEENSFFTLNVPRSFLEVHTLVFVGENGEYKVCTTATNFPEVHQYQHNAWASGAKHCRDVLHFKSQWASIPKAQMRWIYRNRYRQKQQAQQIESSKNHVEEEPKNERQLQYIQAEPAIPLNKYDAAGRNLHYGSIGIGVVALFFAFASIWWLSDETRKEKKELTFVVLRDTIHAKQALV